MTHTPSPTQEPFTSAAIEALLTPQTVTIVGASENAAPARHLMANLFDGDAPFGGQINLINRSRPTLYGRTALASTADVEGDPGLVILLVGSPHCLPALRGFSHLPQGVVVYSSGAESGFDDVERYLRQWSYESDVPLLGPQATGIIRPGQSLVALTAPLRAAPVAGGLGLIMQSAGLLGGMINALWQRQIGVHTAVSLGNSAVLDYADLARHLVDQDGVRALAVYVDGLAGMDDLIDVAARAQRRDKPLVLCVGGSSEAGGAAVQSHTGALATPRRVLRGIADQFGIVLVEDTDELVWTVEAFEQMRYQRPTRGGVGIFSTSGGGAIMLADAMSAAGAELPMPGADTRSNLSRKKPVISFNPFDVGAAALDAPAEVNRALHTFAADPAFSVVVSVATVGLPTLTGMAAYVRQTTDFIDGVRAAGKQPMIAAPVAGAPNRAGAALASWDDSVTAQGSKEAAIKARSICDWGKRVDVPAHSVPLPQQGPAASPLAESEVTVVSGPEAEHALRGLALSWPRSRTVFAANEIESTLDQLPLPIVAKVEAGLAHRAANGGVIRGLGARRAAVLAVQYLLARFAAPVALTEQIMFSTELTLGFQADPRNGPLAMFGRGGGDVGQFVDFRRLPMTPGQIAALIARHVDDDDHRKVVAALFETFQDYVLDREDIVSLDLNPIVVAGGSVWALDAKIHTSLPESYRAQHRDQPH